MPQQSQAQQGYVQYPPAAPAQYVYYSQQAFGWVPSVYKELILAFLIPSVNQKKVVKQLKHEPPHPINQGTRAVRIKTGVTINNEIAWSQKYISEDIFINRVVMWDC